MKKGQLSLDLLLTLIVAIIFFNVYIAHVDNLKTQVEESALDDSLKTVLLDVYSVTSSAKTFGTTIVHTTKSINFEQDDQPIECQVTIGNNDIEVRSGSKTVSFVGIDLADITITPNPFTCGERITIRNEVST